MKPAIHPEYQEVKTMCACGASFTTRSTAKELRVEICAECHPFFTGKQKLVDTAGRVERFQKRYRGGAPAVMGGQAPSAEKAGDKPGSSSAS